MTFPLLHSILLENQSLRQYRQSLDSSHLHQHYSDDTIEQLKLAAIDRADGSVAPEVLDFLSVLVSNRESDFFYTYDIDHNDAAGQAQVVATVDVNAATAAMRESTRKKSII